MSNNQSITMENEEPKFYARIPNMLDDDLNPYEYRLYGHYKRVAGEHGTCYESAETTAKICQMSRAQVFNTRKSLLEKGLISLESAQGETTNIVILDVWKLNRERYTRLPDRQGVSTKKTPTRLPSVHKEELIEEKPSKNGKRKPSKTLEPLTEIEKLGAVHYGKNAEEKYSQDQKDELAAVGAIYAARGLDGAAVDSFKGWYLFGEDRFGTLSMVGALKLPNWLDRWIALGKPDGKQQESSGVNLWKKARREKEKRDGTE